MYRKIVFDMDGVIRIGNHLIDGSDKILDYMGKNHINGALCTNEDRYTEDELREDLSEMGFEIPDTWQVITSGMVVTRFLHDRILKHPDRHYDIGIVGETGLYSTLASLTELSNCTITERPRASDTQKFLVIGTLNTMKMSALNKALEWIKAGARVEYGVTHVIQPGGSIRDAEVQQAAQAHKMTMTMCGKRMFLH